MSEKVDLTPAVLDILLYAGDGTDFQLIFKDDNEVVIDVSALTWTSQIRKTRTSDTAFDIIIDISSAADGIITLHISDTVSRALSERGQWDLQCTSDTRPEPLTIVQGSVKCQQDVTRTL